MKYPSKLKHITVSDAREINTKIIVNPCRY